MYAAPPDVGVERWATTAGIPLAARAGKEVEMGRRPECSCWSGQSNQRQGREQAQFAHAVSCPQEERRGSVLEERVGGEFGSFYPHRSLKETIYGNTIELFCATGRLRAVRTPIPEAHTPHTSRAILETHTHNYTTPKTCVWCERERRGTSHQSSSKRAPCLLVRAMMMMMT